ncbi:MAG: hypothetical protein ACK4KV_19120 [Rhodocyclaceae bacterium]
MDTPRVTELEHRLSALRTLTGMLIAHLDDNGLIDREVLQADLAVALDQVEQPDRVACDVAHVFRIADVMQAGWTEARARAGGEQSPG